MTGWTDVDPSLDTTPIQGSGADFLLLQGNFNRVSLDIGTISSRFSALQAGDSSKFEGQAATAFVALLGDVGHKLQAVPPVADQIAQIFGLHSSQLLQLSAKVNTALGVALTTRSERDAATTVESAASARQVKINAQISALTNAGATPDDPALTSLQSQAVTARTAMSAASARLLDAQNDLRAAVQQYRDFQEDESHINRATAAKLREVDLGDMGDPSKLEKVGQGALSALDRIKDWGLEALQDLVDLAKAAYKGLMEGQWEDFWWRLNDVLRVVALVLAIVSLFVPGIGIFIAGLIIGALLVASSALLASQGWVNKETGQKMTWATVAMDGAALVATGVLGGMRIIKFKAFKNPTIKFTKSFVPKGGTESIRKVTGSKGFVSAPVAKRFESYSRDDLVLNRLEKGFAANEIAGVVNTPGLEGDLRLAPPYSSCGATRGLVGSAI